MGDISRVGSGPRTGQTRTWGSDSTSDMGRSPSRSEAGPGDWGDDWGDLGNAGTPLAPSAECWDCVVTSDVPCLSYAVQSKRSEKSSLWEEVLAESRSSPWLRGAAAGSPHGNPPAPRILERSSMRDDMVGPRSDQ